MFDEEAAGKQIQTAISGAQGDANEVINIGSNRSIIGRKCISHTYTSTGSCLRRMQYVHILITRVGCERRVDEMNVGDRQSYRVSEIYFN
jgi:hypothetical protein